MVRHIVRGRLAGVCAAGALLAAGAAPASAGALVAAAPAAADSHLRITARDVLVAPGHRALGWIGVTADGSTGRAGVPVTLDIELSALTPLGDVAASGDGWDCTRRARVVACTGHLDRSNRTPRLTYQITARPDAPLGAVARLTISGASAAGSGTGTGAVTVVEGLDLQTAPQTPLVVAPGGRLELPSVVRPSAPGTLAGAVLVLTTDPLLTYAGSFRNCRHQAGRPTVCRFDRDLRPGVTYRLSAPLPLTLDPATRPGLVLANRLQWWTADDWALVENDPDEPLPPDTPGTGSELRLVAEPWRGDAASWDSWTDVAVTVDPSAEEPAPPSPAAGTGGGDDEPLPVTGGATGVLGLVLVAAGLGGYLVARRRRTRFVV